MVTNATKLTCFRPSYVQSLDLKIAKKCLLLINCLGNSTRKSFDEGYEVSVEVICYIYKFVEPKRNISNATEQSYAVKVVLYVSHGIFFSPQEPLSVMWKI